MPKFLLRKKKKSPEIKDLQPTPTSSGVLWSRIMLSALTLLILSAAFSTFLLWKIWNEASLKRFSNNENQTQKPMIDVDKLRKAADIIENRSSE